MKTAIESIFAVYVDCRTFTCLYVKRRKLQSCYPFFASFGKPKQKERQYFANAGKRYFFFSFLYQHNIYNWNVEKDEFKRLDKFTFISNKLKKILDQSLEKMNNEQKQEFVESLFNVIKEMTDNDIIQFGDSFLSFALRFRKAFKMQNDDTKKLIYSIFTSPNDDEKEIKYIEPIHNKKSVLDKIKDRFSK